jgi:hypothetical protein
VWRGEASPSLLDSYSPERSAIGDQVLRNAGNLTRITIVRHPILQEIRGLAADVLGRIPALRQRLVDQLTEIDLHYAHTPLNATVPGAARHPANGERAPDIGLDGDVAGPRRLHGLLGSGKFVVLSTGGHRPDVPEHLRSIAVAAVATAENEGTGKDAGYPPDHLYLIRPDAYVAASTRGDDVAPIFSALTALRQDGGTHAVPADGMPGAKDELV